MTEDDVRSKIRAAAPEGKMPCTVAFRLAEELGIPRKELGSLLNELRIKIIQCQMGCF
jgi:hypothetical protein